MPCRFSEGMVRVSPETIALAILLVGVIALVGKYIRVRVRLVQKLFLPVSIIGGFLALVLGPEVLGRLADLVGISGLRDGGVFGAGVLDVWSELPGLLISAVFATMFLGAQIPSPRRAVRLLGPQLSLGLTFASGQYVVGLVLTLLVLTPLFGVPHMFGALIEIGFEGGHGTAAGMADVMTDLDFAGGGDLALAMATVGIVSGVIIGVIVINWAARTGRTETFDARVEMSESALTGLYNRYRRPYGSTLTVRPESLEALTFHVGIVAVAILLGQALLSGLQAIENALWADSIEIFAYVPLFPLAMLGGVVLQLVAQQLGIDDFISGKMMERIQGLSLDMLIISALAALSLDAIAENIGAFAILAIAGVGWNVFVLLYFTPRFIRRYWLERGIGDFGQSMGVTATGLLLMRMADPENKSPAYEAFGYKQLVFEPFFGGGLVTAAAVPLIAQLGPYPLLIAMSVLLVLAIGSGLFYFGRRPEFAVEGRDSA